MTLSGMRIIAVCLIILCCSCLAPVAAHGGADIAGLRPGRIQGSAGVDKTPDSVRIFGKQGRLAPEPMPAGLLPTARRWKAVQERQTRYGHIGKNGSMPAPVLKQWQALVAGFSAMDAAGQLRAINGFFNGWRQIPDSDNYGEEEYWSCAGEFLEKGGGDCEDFVLIKYTALRQLGWPSGKLWALIVRDAQRKGQGHAVLAARLGKTLYILDNLARPTYLIMDNTAFIKRYLPVLALNEEGIWVFPADRKAPPIPRKTVSQD